METGRCRRRSVAAESSAGQAPVGWIAAVLLLAGCASGGTLVTAGELASLAPGRASYDELVSKLGRPTTSTTAPDGTRIAIYSYERMHTRATTFLPVVGGFVGGTDAQTSWAVCYFDRAGVLESCKITSSRTVERPL